MARKDRYTKAYARGSHSMAGFLPAYLSKEPCLVEKYGHLKPYMFNTSGIQVVLVLADEDGDIQYKPPYIECETLKEMEEKYGKKQ